MEDYNILFNIQTKKRNKKIKFLNSKYRMKKNNNNNFIHILLFLFITTLILIPILFLIKRTRIKRFEQKINIYNKFNLRNIKNIFNYSIKYEEFDENINEQYIQLQNYFCKNQNENLIQEYENRIIKGEVNYLKKRFDFFIYYTNNDAVSNFIKKNT